MEALERFVNDDDGQLPTLAKVALAHAQLETIHPFLDGNGRVGRLVIALMLHNDGVLRQPLLYLSLYLKQHRSEYDRLLELVRTEGDGDAWLDFVLLGVIETADAAVDTAGRLLSLFREDAERIRGLGRAAANALRVFDALRARPVTTVNDLASRAGVAYPTAARAVAALEKTGITREITGRNRNRVYVYERYLDLLNEGAEPL
jgi:Fic family protein